MDNLFVVCEPQPREAQSVRRQLEGVFKTVSVPVDRLREAGPPGPYTLIGTNLGDRRPNFRHQGLAEKESRKARRSFSSRKGRRALLETLQAYAIGATDLVHRPFDGKTPLRKLYGDFAALAGSAC